MSRQPSPAPSTQGESEVPLVKVEGLLAQAKPWAPMEVELPTNVSDETQLKDLPPECLSGDPLRPLQHIDDRGDSYRYSLKPMFYSVIFILLVELLERFSFYGINYTQTSFLTGAYDKHWNAGMSSVMASAYVSVSIAVAYTMPFAGAFLADSVLGDYYSILFGSLCWYLPGLCLIALTTIPGMLGETFNTAALSVGLLVLWPIGTGLVKSVVNVFGAKQFHPLLQSSLIESYYVNFYMCINIGALAGGILVPVIAQHDITLAYFIPVGVLAMGVACFVAGTPRYVRTKPRGDLLSKQAQKMQLQSSPLDENSSSGLETILRIGILIIPFCIAYSQMATTFIVQGTVMKKACGFIDAATMNNADAVAVLLFGYLIGAVMYPALARRSIKIPTTYKFAIGSALGALAIGWALFVEYKIHATYQATGEPVSIMWQALAYVLIGAGEIFAVSSAYEVAFTAAPPNRKALASAVNLFCVGGIPSFLCIALYYLCAPWFRNSKGNANIAELEDYVEAKVSNYFWVLFIISLAGVGVNLLPAVKDWVASIEEEAAAALKTPGSTPKTPRRPIRHKNLPESDENSALVQVKKHQNYLKYGSGPTLYKHGSFRAGVILQMAKDARKKRPPKYVRYGNGLTLFKNSGSMERLVRSEMDAKTDRETRSLEEAFVANAKNPAEEPAQNNINNL